MMRFAIILSTLLSFTASANALGFSSGKAQTLPGESFTVISTNTRITEDFFDICESKVPGRYCVQKFGENPEVTTAEDLWTIGGIRVHPAITGETHYFESSSGNDDTDDGTGCRELRVEGVDGSWNLETEHVALQGLTAVASTITWAGINTAYCTKAGSGGKNAGIVKGYVIGGATSAYINANDGRTLQVHYYVPVNHFLHVIDYFITAINDAGTQRWGTAEGRVILGANTATASDTVGRIFSFVSRVGVNSGSAIRPPFSASGGSIVYIAIREVSGGTIDVAGGFSGVLTEQ